MKLRAVIITLAFLGSLSAAADECSCRINIARKELPSVSAQSESECYAQHVAPLLKPEKLAGYCPSDTGRITLMWKCTPYGHKVEAVSIGVDCSGSSGALAAELISDVRLVSKLNFRPQAVSGDCGEQPRSEPALPSLGAERMELSFATLEELEAALKSLAPRAILDRPVDKWQFGFFLPNDNKGFGVIDRLFGSTKDDSGYTHEMRVSASKGLGDGYHLTFEYRTSLYTQYIDSTYREDPHTNYTIHIDQYFLEENMLKLILDDQDKRKPRYFRAGVGWQNLNNERVGNPLVSAVGQQRMVHNFLNREKDATAKDVTNIGRGKNDNGLYGDGVMGLQYLGSEPHWFRAYVEGGGGASTINRNIAHVRAEAGASIDYEFSRTKSIRLGISAEDTKYNDGSPTQRLQSIYFTLGSESFNCGARWTHRSNRGGPGYQEFNNDKDPILELRCQGTH